MLIRFVCRAAAGVLMLATAGHTGDREYRLGDITIHAPWALATPTNALNGAVYFEIRNSAQIAHMLSGAASPAAAQVQIHRSTQKNGLMQMQHLHHGLPLPPTSSLHLQPHGLHLMLMGLHQPLGEGEHFTLTLEFAHIGHLEITVPVVSPDHAIENRTGHTEH